MASERWNKLVFKLSRTVAISKSKEGKSYIHTEENSVKNQSNSLGFLSLALPLTKFVWQIYYKPTNIYIRYIGF